MKPARVIVADCPWSFRNRHAVRKDGGKTRFGVGVSHRYSNGVMETEDIAALPVASICADDAYLFLWTTLNHTRECFAVAEAWGFNFVGSRFTWSKVYRDADVIEDAEDTDPLGDPNEFAGPGRYVMSDMEDCWMFRRGDIWHPKTGYKPRQLIRAAQMRDPATKKIIHSRKPEALQDRIDEWLDPYLDPDDLKLELFATRPRADWMCLGHELNGHLLQEDLPELAAQIAVTKAIGGLTLCPL